MQDVEVQVDGSPKAPSRPAALPLDDFASAGSSVRGTGVSGEFRSSDCGYGVVVRRGLPPCPMCGGTVWESRAPHDVD